MSQFADFGLIGSIWICNYLDLMQVISFEHFYIFYNNLSIFNIAPTFEFIIYRN